LTNVSTSLINIQDNVPLSQADPGFQVRGEGALKKIAPSGGRRELFCFVFRVNNHDFTPKNHIFSNFNFMVEEYISHTSIVISDGGLSDLVY
jgi:hypothetical protein